MVCLYFKHVVQIVGKRYTKYGIQCHVIILCHYSNFSDDTSYEQANKYCHGWWMSLSIGQNSTFACQSLAINIVMNDWNLD